jgi:hypothetical protein
VNAQIVHTYDYTGEYQTFTPVFSGYYKIELWGAQGGTVETTYGLGGYGSYTSGEIYLNAGENLYVYVGGSGGKATGGWNGGGVSSIYSSTSYGGNGGGATDVRVVATLVKSGWSDSESLRSRIMVAAGGGGGYYYFGSNTSSWQSYSTSSGGSGGGLSGYDGMKLYYPDRLSSSVNEYGTGGTQIAGGYQSTNPTNYVGGFGFGSNSGMATGGGGSGYYGGGSGDNTNGGGGGGSSYVSGHAGCIAVTSDGTPKVSTYSTLEDSIHYTGYKFINTEMIDGSGYSWTTTKASSTKGMPTHDGTSTITGNAGNGYAKITLLTVEVKTE